MQIIFEVKTGLSIDGIKAAIKDSRHPQSESLGATDHIGAYAPSKEETLFTQKLCIYELLSLANGVSVWKFTGERDDFAKEFLRPACFNNEAWGNPQIISAGSPLGSFVGSNALNEYDARKASLELAAENSQRLLKELILPLAATVGVMWLISKAFDRK